MTRAGAEKAALVAALIAVLLLLFMHIADLLG
jgi:hypothetical protein